LEDRTLAVHIGQRRGPLIARQSSADVSGANFNQADVNSARLISLRGKESARNLDSVKNLDRAYVE
jgi:hypothetical protein